ncbi:hypothetical protein [Streptomyces bluensis]|uniref:hypothetical protein n=1 Tax=Streptomyces bluensis TaxID=33897 RepID=UPI003326CDEA
MTHAAGLIGAAAELIGAAAALVGLGVLTLVSVRSISRRCGAPASSVRPRSSYVVSEVPGPPTGGE